MRSVLRLSLAAWALVPYVSASLGLGIHRRQLQEPLLDIYQKDTDPALLFPAHNISVPIDHFHDESTYEPHSVDTFPLRYWFDGSHYKKGGPVIVLLGGETDGAGRLPFLQKGILARLAEATHGVGVILEHRYYGTSVPTPDLSTGNMRFLTTQQALADLAYFAKNIKFPGLEKHNLTSDDAAWISYGGSYAGAMSAFLRVVYPDIFWGAISSSGVPEAIVDYWQYWSPIIQAGPIGCIDTQQTLIGIIDKVLLDKKHAKLKSKLKHVFGLGKLTHDSDFGATVSNGVYGWQSLNWDPKMSSNGFYDYCDIITNSSVVYPATLDLEDEVTSIINATGIEKDYTVTAMLNMIGYVNKTQVSTCSGKTQDECLGIRHAFAYGEHDLSQTWRLWFYQVCTQWGYFQTGSGTPANHRPIISRTVDLDHSSLVCRKAFNISSMPNVDEINQYGGYNLAADRLAWVDGEVDPWRPAGVHGFDEGAPRRKNTINQPFILIPNAVHHWDENGLFDNETTRSMPPRPIQKVQAEEISFVKAWVEQWHAERGSKQ